MTLLDIDANDIAKYSDRIKKAYHNEGALIVRHVLDQIVIDEILYNLLDLINILAPEIYDNLISEYPNDLYKKSSNILQVVFKNFPETQSIIYDAMSQTPLMNKMSAHEDILSVIKIILSDHILTHPRHILLMSMPNELWHLAGWHQDFYYNKGPKDTCTVYAPLQFTNEMNGGLKMAIKSHLNDCFQHAAHDHGASTKWNTLSAEIVSQFDEIFQIEMEPGDVLFLHSLTAHSASPNKSKDVRFVMNFRYRDMTDEMFKQDGWRVPEIKHARDALKRKSSDQ